jgi:hypothetical protein
MGMLDQVMASDAVAFLDPDGFGESVVYTKRDSTTRDIVAIVDRDPPVHGQALRPKMRLVVANNSTTGISSAELDTGDTITVPYRIGDTAGVYRIRRAPSYRNQPTEDSGMIDLELE